MTTALKLTADTLDYIVKTADLDIKSLNDILHQVDEVDTYYFVKDPRMGATAVDWAVFPDDKFFEQYEFVDRESSYLFSEVRAK